MADSTIVVRDLNAYVCSIVNKGEIDPLKWLTDTDAFAHSQAAYQEVARELRGRNITIFTKESPAIRIPASATSITADAQTATSFVGSGLNDVTFGGTYTGTDSVSFTVVVQTAGTPDTFKWKKNDGSYTTGVAMTGSAQTLSDGVTVTWAATTGHTVADYAVFMSYLYPSDLVRPQQMRERTATTPTVAAGTYQLMSMNDGTLPDLAAALNRQVFDWRNQTLVFNASTVIRDMQILYEFEVPILRMPYQEVLIPEGYTVVAFRAAAYAAGSIGKMDQATNNMETSKLALGRITTNEMAIRKGTGTQWGQPVTVATT